MHSYSFEGAAGFKKMEKIMDLLRKINGEIGPKKIEKFFDYSLGIDNLPKSNVLKFYLDGNCSLVARPSGTEPKLKLYVSVSAKTKEEAIALESELTNAFELYT
ncbi:MAG: hypothetical protein MJ189_05970 [Coriobacteriales bacterium]|nr:hypothetical protein [Coriobacteriales bacterium]